MPSRRRFLAAIGAGSLGALAGCAGESAVSGPWPRAGYDRRNSGYAPDATGPRSSPTVRWQTSIPEGVSESSPVVMDGRVFLGYGTSRYNRPRRVGLRVLDADTGETLRGAVLSTYRGDRSSGRLYWDSLVADGDSLYLVAFDGLHALDRHGEERWHVSFGGGPANSNQECAHPVVADGTVYAPTASTTSDTDGTEALYAIDAASGDERWRYETQGEDGWTFPPAYADGVVYLAVLDRAVVALDAATGEELWRRSLLAYGPPTVADGRVFVSADAAAVENESHVVALDAATGEEVWRATMPGARVGRRIAAADGLVYHRQDLAYLVARDAATGDEVWRYADAGMVHRGVPVVTDDALYVTVDMDSIDDSGVAVLDPKTGESLAFVGLGLDAHLDASLAVADGLSFASASSGRVYAFEECSLPVAGHCLA